MEIWHLSRANDLDAEYRLLSLSSVVRLHHNPQASCPYLGPSIPIIIVQATHCGGNFKPAETQEAQHRLDLTVLPAIKAAQRDISESTLHDNVLSRLHSEIYCQRQWGD